MPAEGYSATVDNPAQGMSAIPCSNIEVNGQALSFNVPSVRGTWTGVVTGDGTTLTGVWNQGQLDGLECDPLVGNSRQAPRPRVRLLRRQQPPAAMS